ncbi:hypothetical protein NUU61_004983 [Penicillium alfredii]|uniref:Aminoglycoside phosphotransferase domain-containing protein n=1 Tax=Penicillium alfredii TaxID=1506179 RepID=A0A9W9K851_9EURO|nr:uncharacterized protein NUU61_004983 [Penicillium alfredii]KAJ5095627.1 hypothetical protein NUU61_004983 [Penicillium alfredii]
MEYNKCLDHIHQAEENIWVDCINTYQVNGRFCEWITSLHPKKLLCCLDGGFMNGSYNLCQKFLFEDGTSWILRFPRPVNVRYDYADEKVAMEVEALKLIREQTTIPVPEVKEWGLADENPFGLGPFIIMDFIEGVRLRDMLTDEGGLLKKDVPETVIETTYRQMVNILLQLWKIDFEHIGSLPTPKTQYPAPIRPLTWKAHEILQTGGPNTFGDRTQGFSTTSEYFQNTIEQDRQQLRHQPNSVTGDLNAENRYASLEILKSLIPQFVNPQYDQGPSKLICDDFGLANIIVRSPDDLTIVGVIDLEWVYAGPAQLFGSAPWWLLYDRPLNEDWDVQGGQFPEPIERYAKCLQIFKRVLAEEESKLLGHPSGLSELVQWSETSGAMWFHMLASGGFFDTFTAPCRKLEEQFGFQQWRDRVDEMGETEEVKTFVAQKVRELELYDEDVEKVEQLKAQMDSGEISREEFVAAASAVPATEGIVTKTQWLHQLGVGP